MKFKDIKIGVNYLSNNHGVVTVIDNENGWINARLLNGNTRYFFARELSPCYFQLYPTRSTAEVFKKNVKSEVHYDKVLELIKLNLKLIEMLENSCTQYPEDNDDMHEHKLFDDIDKRDLNEIKKQLQQLLN